MSFGKPTIGIVTGRVTKSTCHVLTNEIDQTRSHDFPDIMRKRMISLTFAGFMLWWAVVSIRAPIAHHRMLNFVNSAMSSPKKKRDNTVGCVAHMYIRTHA